MKVKKVLVPIDTVSVVGTLGYGYTSKKEFKKDYEEVTGEKLNKEDYADLSFTKVLKYEKNGEDFYDWSGDDCPCCGGKNNGVMSIIDLH